MSPHSERPHSLYYLTINNSQEEYLKLELPNHRWMYATKAAIPILFIVNHQPGLLLWSGIRIIKAGWPSDFPWSKEFDSWTCTASIYSFE